MDQCLVVCQNFRDFYEEQVADVTRELEGRMYLYFALLGVAALAIATGIIGLFGSKGFIFGIITSIAAIGANIYGMMGGYTGYTYQLRDMDASGEYLVNAAGEYTYTYSGKMQLVALLTIAVVAIIFTVVAIIAKKNRKAELAFDMAEVTEQ